MQFLRVSMKPSIATPYHSLNPRSSHALAKLPYKNRSSSSTSFNINHPRPRQACSSNGYSSGGLGQRLSLEDHSHTVEVDDENPQVKCRLISPRCRREVQKKDLSACQPIVTGRSEFALEGEEEEENQQKPQMTERCCSPMRNMEPMCQCEVVQCMSYDMQIETPGIIGWEAMQRAKEIVSRCNIPRCRNQ